MSVTVGFDIKVVFVFKKFLAQDIPLEITYFDSE